MWRNKPVPAHHPSHRTLLRRRRLAVRRAALDAIVVPSARAAEAVVHAGELARQLNCPLIVLASRQALGAEILARLAPLNLKGLHIVDVPADLASRLPAFRTSRILAGAGMARTTDVSAKRNLGLAVARMAGFKRVLFLDDDMRIPRAADLKRAAGLLRSHDAVGLRLGGFPDNSVVCHASRETGKFQDTFVGGGALVVATDRPTSFFPDLYNEDWFFLLDESRLRPVTVTGTALQKAYDPYASVDRARMEEFGDVLAEGIFAVLDDKREIWAADLAYWREFIGQRRDLIGRTIRRAKHGQRNARKNGKMIRSLLAARSELDKRVNAKLCVQFMDAWRYDLASWKEFCENLVKVDAVELAFGRFGLECVVPPATDQVARPVPAEPTAPATPQREPALVAAAATFPAEPGRRSRRVGVGR
jgi:hypothetical protein